ncbi:MAG: hypothetical protein LBC84_02680 [Prevotellaceae bacterium]|jgi:hypothetical protein|nr:hypothetical protein [Prevotellaceae bacterium]
MKTKILIKKSISLLITTLLVNGFIYGQSWSTEYILVGDSTVYSFSPNKIVQGNSIDFFFPAYKYHQIATTESVESIFVENEQVIEIEFYTRSFDFSRINIEIDMYAEAMDTIRFFLKTTDDRLIFVTQRTHRQGYTYLPTVNFSINISNNEYKSIQIVGISKNEEKMIVGRVRGAKKIEYIADSMIEVDSFLSGYDFEKHSDTFVELPDHHLRLHGFNLRPRLALHNCNSATDSVECISQFTNKILNDYKLYDVYGINKQDLIDKNALLSKTSKEVGDYYNGMKEIIASLHSCHLRLSTSVQDEVESPLQPIYLYNIKNEIAVAAIFDPTIKDEIQLGDRLLSINNIPIEKLYDVFSNKVYASTSQQREIKITQKLLFLAKEWLGDSLLLTFRNDTSSYSVLLNESNFSGKRQIPSDFKLVSDNVLEKFNKIAYIKPVFQESNLIPYIYSHKTDMNNSDGMIIDLRGCSNADYSFCTFFSFLISKNTLILTTDSTFINTCSNFIVKPSRQINAQKPVIILIDARTACGPELMINALRGNRSDVYVMGTTNSAGSAQYTMGFDLPRKAVMSYFEGIAKDAFGQAIDNNIGIEPDKKVHFDSYRDLFPYQDRLKLDALHFLGYTVEDNDESRY